MNDYNEQLKQNLKGKGISEDKASRLIQKIGILIDCQSSLDAKKSDLVEFCISNEYWKSDVSVILEVNLKMLEENNNPQYLISFKDMIKYVDDVIDSKRLERELGNDDSKIQLHKFNDIIQTLIAPDKKNLTDDKKITIISAIFEKISWTHEELKALINIVDSGSYATRVQNIIKSAIHDYKFSAYVDTRSFFDVFLNGESEPLIVGFIPFIQKKLNTGSGVIEGIDITEKIIEEISALDFSIAELHKLVTMINKITENSSCIDTQSYNQMVILGCLDEVLGQKIKKVLPLINKKLTDEEITEIRTNLFNNFDDNTDEKLILGEELINTLTNNGVADIDKEKIQTLFEIISCMKNEKVEQPIKENLLSDFHLLDNTRAYIKKTKKSLERPINSSGEKNNRIKSRLEALNKIESVLIGKKEFENNTDASKFFSEILTELTNNSPKYNERPWGKYIRSLLNYCGKKFAGLFVKIDRHQTTEEKLQNSIFNHSKFADSSEDSPQQKKSPNAENKMQ